MKIICQLLLLSLLSVIGCRQSDDTVNQPDKKGLLLNQVITVSSTDREYHLFVPDNATDAPIVLLFHGNRGSHDELLGLTGVKAPYKVWLDIAEQDNIIIAVPNGTLGSNNQSGWNDCRTDAQTNPALDDVLFISALIDFIVNTYGANAAKVYALGTSIGGHMAIRLAQELPQKLTAFGAIVAASPVNSQCNDSNMPISALFMNGTSDPILPYEGGQMASNRGEVLSAENTVEYWVSRNITDPTPVTTNISDSAITDGTIEKREYKNGMNNSEVVVYKIINGGHTEPSMVERYGDLFLALVGHQNGDIEMAEEIWAFFKTKTK